MICALVERHIALHLATGYVFRTQTGLLRSFARYAQSQGDEVVRAQTAIIWAAQGPTAGTRRGRLHLVCRFARLMQAEDPCHEVPPPDVFGPQPPRRTPFIFSPGQICELLEATATLGPWGSLRPKTYHTMLGLLAATGLRISEALALRLNDVTGADLVIRETKFKKTRLVPLHHSTSFALDAYLLARQPYARDDDAIFLSERGTGLKYSSVIATFLRLVRGIDLHPGPGMLGPRIHDLRHTFAVRSLEQCAGDRASISRHMLALSTYLGHAALCHTYWYLEATPRLLADVAAITEAVAMRGAR